MLPTNVEVFPCRRINSKNIFLYVTLRTLFHIVYVEIEEKTIFYYDN